MLWIHGFGTTLASWRAVITTIPRLTLARAQLAQLALRGIMASMLIGHGGYGLVMGKPALLHFYDAVGLGSVGLPLPTLRAVIGGGEILLGVLCLEVTSTAFFLLICVWKLTTELFHVPAQAYGAWWEVIERGSSYAAPLVWMGLHQFLCQHGSSAGGWLSGSERRIRAALARRC